MPRSSLKPPDQGHLFRRSRPKTGLNLGSLTHQLRSEGEDG